MNCIGTSCEIERDGNIKTEENKYLRNRSAKSEEHLLAKKQTFLSNWNKITVYAMPERTGFHVGGTNEVSKITWGD